MSSTEELMKTLGMEDTGPSVSAPDAAPATPQTAAEADAAAESDVCDEQALENYRTWKKNVPFLYDVVIVCFPIVPASCCLPTSGQTHTHKHRL